MIKIYIATFNQHQPLTPAGKTNIAKRKPFGVIRSLVFDAALHKNLF